MTTKLVMWLVRSMTWMVLLSPVLSVAFVHWIIGLSVGGSVAAGVTLAVAEALFLGEFLAIVFAAANALKCRSQGV